MTNGATNLTKSRQNDDVLSNITGVIRTNEPIYETNGYFYFEIEVERNGENRGAIAIGLSPASSFTEDHPGLAPNSFGYDSDGYVYCDTEKYYVGEEFEVGDIVGCYADFTRKVVYFTKNGFIVSEPVNNITKNLVSLPENLYPTIGMSSVGDLVKTNFGEETFVFDVEGKRFQ